LQPGFDSFKFIHNYQITFLFKLFCHPDVSVSITLEGSLGLLSALLFFVL